MSVFVLARGEEIEEDSKSLVMLHEAENVCLLQAYKI
jgi:hypothetical protein